MINDFYGTKLNFCLTETTDLVSDSSLVDPVNSIFYYYALSFQLLVGEVIC